jgi:hypothetical protein
LPEPSQTKVVQIVLSDSAMDRMIDDLTERAGYERGFTSPLNLARWDLAYVLRKEAERQRGVFS